MNPFDLRGPEFLFFYILLSGGMIGLVSLLRRMLEYGPLPKFGEVDPYLVAYLRGGKNETLRVATISLLDRGLLKAEGESLTAEEHAVERARRPLERKILEEFAVGATAYNIFSSGAAREACRSLEDELKRQNLLPGSKQWAVRVLLGLGAIATLWWIGYIKIEVALSRGRHNLGFLGLLLLAVPIAVILVLRSRRTSLGSRVLRDLKTLFSGLRNRRHAVRSGGATNELALLAGVFGLGALSGTALTQAQELFPKGTRDRAGSSIWGGSCGAACGYAASTDSSGGSSCGSSCGGGGCGGGCGGCGG